jgi:hypothetical protein
MLASAPDTFGWQVGDYGLDCSYDCNGVVITNYSGPGGMVNIPSRFGSNDVVGIVSPAFFWKQNVTGVVVPDTVVYIGSHAFFNATNLASVVFGNQLANIGDGAFENCTALASLTVPNSVTNIGKQAFTNCVSLTQLSLGNGLRTISEEAFFNCKSLTALLIPAGLESIERRAFADCTNLQSISTNSASSLIRIGTNAFDSCYNLKFVSLPNNLTLIEKSAFRLCRSLVEINLPNSLTTLEEGVFNSCFSLPNLWIPSGVTNIIGRPCGDCTNMTAFLGGSDQYFCTDGLLVKHANRELIQCPSGIAGQVPIRDPILRVGLGAFGGCSRVTEVTMGTNVHNIGASAFAGCSSITNIILGDGLTNISDGAFWVCSSLTNISLPIGLLSIGEGVFDACTKLSSITVHSQNLNFDDSAGVLFDFYHTALLRYPEAKSGPEYTVPNGIVHIGESAFQGCTTLLKIILPASVTSVGAEAFSELQKSFFDNQIRYVLFKGNAPTIDAPGRIFQLSDTASPKRVPGTGGWTDPWSGKSLGLWIPEVPALCTLENGGLVIGQYLGAGGEVSIPSGVNQFTIATIGYPAFGGQTNLTRVTIPASITTIKDWAFTDCSNLSVVFFEGNAPKLESDWRAFTGCDNATIYYTPETLGWSDWWCQHEAVLWNPQAEPDLTFGVSSNLFGFTISGTIGLQVVVDAATNMANPVWIPLRTNVLTGGSSYFSDPQWTNHPDRYYRFRLP